MYRCHMEFYLVNCPPDVLETVQQLPPLDGGEGSGGKVPAGRPGKNGIGQCHMSSLPRYAPREKILVHPLFLCE